MKTWAEKYERPEQLAHVKSCEQCQKTQDLEMAQSCNSRLRARDMKDYSNDYCDKGKETLKALYAMYERDGG